MQNIMLAIHLIIALLLIVSVLIQRSEGGGLGVGGGNNNAKPAGDGGLDGMQKLTWALGAAFIISSITLTLTATSDTGGTQSILDQLNGVDTGAIIENAVEESDAPSTPTDPNAATTLPTDPADPNAAN